MKACAYEYAPALPGRQVRGNVSPLFVTSGRVAEWQTLGT